MKNNYVQIHDFEWKVLCLSFGCTTETEAMEFARDCAFVQTNASAQFEQPHLCHQDIMQ
jgi:hypothetical protein